MSISGCFAHDVVVFVEVDIEDAGEFAGKLIIVVALPAQKIDGPDNFAPVGQPALGIVFGIVIHE